MFAKQQCFYLGLITKPHGIKGNVVVYLDVDRPEFYYEMESVFVDINNSLVPFFIESTSPKTGKQMVVKFEGISTEQEAKTMVNKELYLPLEVLPQLSETQFYFHEVPGFYVVDQRAGSIGRVTGVLEYPNNNLLQVDFNGKELLLPITDEVIVRVDRQQRTIFTMAPEGLIDVFTTDKHQRDED
ncbi:MAG TPA: ribosome maturation factor RimM [Luteibaculaceae bacterium]|nr:ribosome maturation factor RimM [Luteibaculaceae bacterium]